MSESGLTDKLDVCTGEYCRTEIEPVVACSSSSTVEFVPCTKKVVTEIVCEPSAHGKVEYFDGYVEGAPPNELDDWLILTSGAVKESGEMFLQRARRRDMQLLYACIIVLNIIFLISAIFGVTSEWFKNLRRDGVNAYLIGSFWVVAAVLAYGGIFMLWRHVEPEEVSTDIRISIWFLVGTFLSVLWAGVFFQGHNLQWSTWLAAILFLYYFWLMIRVWLLKASAGAFLLPLVVVYGYFLYASIHACFLNGAPI